MESGTGKNGIRLLLLLAVVVGAASVAFDYHLDKTSRTARDAAQRTDQTLDALEAAVRGLASTQSGYVAQGQDPDTWMARADDLIETLQLSFSHFQSRPLVAEARMHLDEATGAFEVVVGADNRARAAVRAEQRLTATDAIFLESRDALDRMLTEVAGARTAERAAASLAADEASRLRLAVHGGALAAVVLIGLVIARMRTRPQVSEAATMAQMLRDLPPPVKNAPAGAVVIRPAAETPAAPEPVPAAAPASPDVDLPAAAELCADLARVMDARDVPALLGRAASVLHASGIIIWVADASGRQLEPLLTHGYADKVVRRLGVLDVDADNVTSEAYRSRKSRQLGGSDDSTDGALAVPLLTAQGCVGVLAAEVRRRTLRPEAMAMARIVAAQFATLISPATDEGTRAAEA